MVTKLHALQLLDADMQFEQTTFTDTLTKKQIYLVLVVNAVTVAIFICIKQIFFIPLACLTITTLCIPHHVHKFFPPEVQLSIFSAS